jgi:hypothetical protein
MGHYAKIENGIVVKVNVVEEDFFNANPEHSSQLVNQLSRPKC